MPKTVHPMDDFEELLMQSLSLNAMTSSADLRESRSPSPESVYPSDEEVIVSYPCQVTSRHLDVTSKRHLHPRLSVPDASSALGHLTKEALEKHTKMFDDRYLNVPSVSGSQFSTHLEIVDQRRALTPSARRKVQPVMEGRIPVSPMMSRSRKTSSNNEEHKVQRIRTFSTSSKGIINQGDSLRRRASAPARRPSDDGSLYGSASSCSSSSSSDFSTKVSPSCDYRTFITSGSNIAHKVILIGSPSVGKTSLASQFMTSEYMGHVDTNQDITTESELAVRLDTEETVLIFVKISPEDDILWHDGASAYLVLYSVSDVTSFQFASRVLADIRETLARKAVVILVATKADIVRNRNITCTEGKKLAAKYKCKYIEISTVLHHKVDDLLVGIVSQIKLSQKQSTKTGEKQAQTSDPHSEFSFVYKVHKATQGLSRVLRKYPSYFRSCDNLLVL